MRLFRLLCLCLLLLVACAPEPASQSERRLVLVTAAPTVDTNNPDSLCNQIDFYWGDNWPLVLSALERLKVLEAGCGLRFDADEYFYRAYLGYGDKLRADGRESAAIDAYTAALDYDLIAGEAHTRLRLVGVTTPQPPPGCDTDIVMAALRDLPPYMPTQGDYVRVEGAGFVRYDQPYTVYGVNYFPRDRPVGALLRDLDMTAIGLELDLMRASGINTLRLHLRHEALFICLGNGAIPNVEAFVWLDALIRAASLRDYTLILVLNDDPDLTRFPLYEIPAHTAAQMVFIAGRYGVEPGVMAYDLRARGDQDYIVGAFTRERVLTWLHEAATIMRQQAPAQLITAGWQDEAEVTAPLVDFISFQNYDNIDALRQEIAIITAATRKPILLAAFGYSTFDADERLQREHYQRVLEAVDRNMLAGWVAWTAFDVPLAVTCPDNSCDDGLEYHYGLWRVGYSPKLAVDVVEAVTGVYAP